MSSRVGATRRLDERRQVARQVRAASPPFAGGPPRATGSRAEDAAAVACYIADMTAQLELMARAARLDLIAYFLAMARAESCAAANGEAEGCNPAHGA